MGLSYQSESSTEQKTVSVLGSTGSVGCNTIDLIERTPEKFRVITLTANTNVKLLADQARKLKPELAVVADDASYGLLKDALAGTDIEIAAGEQAVVDAANLSSEIIIAGIVGAAGLKPTLSAVRRGATIGLANKECLVAAGDLFMAEVKANNATLIPTDSEHNAIYQVFDFDHPERVEKIILTASGGPFRTSSHEDMAHATPQQAVAHPVWQMGAKISIDSATMMNKGLELIEAYHLFPVALDQIETLVHPQSVIHSMVGYVDGSVLAQLGTPDMSTPISYALAWPDRIATPSPRLDLSDIGSLTFEQPDFKRFPALNLARESLRAGGCRPCVLNAANEIAVQHFLAGDIGFLDIARVVEEVLSECAVRSIDTLDDVHETDQDARNKASALIISKFMHI
ncbi:MAG: 1-deoxy-D-xylulose-5-phosphate reductoisomerase [Rhodospirillales bacterium]|nr:1-deoxy-D-xylulose-5-phosphate reductoisomerase [Rhodospirillales bacterium]